MTILDGFVGLSTVMPAPVAGIHVLLACQISRGWPGISAFTRVFDALCPAMTRKGHGRAEKKV